MAEWVEVVNKDDHWWYIKHMFEFYISRDLCVIKWEIIKPEFAVAGPFETLDAAKAALVMLSEV